MPHRLRHFMPALGPVSGGAFHLPGHHLQHTVLSHRFYQLTAVGNCQHQEGLSRSGNLAIILARFALTSYSTLRTLFCQLPNCVLIRSPRFEHDHTVLIGSDRAWETKVTSTKQSTCVWWPMSCTSKTIFQYFMPSRICATSTESDALVPITTKWESI